MCLSKSGSANVKVDIYFPFKKTTSLNFAIVNLFIFGIYVFYRRFNRKNAIYIVP